MFIEKNGTMMPLEMYQKMQEEMEVEKKDIDDVVETKEDQFTQEIAKNSNQEENKSKNVDNDKKLDDEVEKNSESTEEKKDSISIDEVKDLLKKNKVNFHHKLGDKKVIALAKKNNLI